mmetsp:Transcript_126912/g.367337  ORF Transcript_126912/g.367337 Transcript_126912/m.367337 type:complete len:326 (+) Transcript_126912:232-1209(+)
MHSTKAWKLKMRRVLLITALVITVLLKIGCLDSAWSSCNCLAFQTLSSTSQNSARVTRPSPFRSSNSKGLSTESAAQREGRNCISFRAPAVSSVAVNSPLFSTSSSLNNCSGVRCFDSSSSHKSLKNMAALLSLLLILDRSFRKQFVARSSCSRCLPTAAKAMDNVRKSTSNLSSTATRRTIWTISSRPGGLSKHMKLIPRCNSSTPKTPANSRSRNAKAPSIVKRWDSAHWLMAHKMDIAESSSSDMAAKSFVNQDKCLLIHLPPNKKPSLLSTLAACRASARSAIELEDLFFLDLDDGTDAFSCRRRITEAMGSMSSQHSADS